MGRCVLRFLHEDPLKTHKEDLITLNFYYTKNISLCNLLKRLQRGIWRRCNKIEGLTGDTEERGKPSERRVHV